MLTKILAITAIVIASLLFTAYNGVAQEPPQAAPDLGDTNILLLGCEYLRETADAQGLGFVNCRRHAPDQINAYRATVTVSVKTVVRKAPFYITLHFQKSLWTVQGFLVEDSPRTGQTQSPLTRPAQSSCGIFCK